MKKLLIGLTSVFLLVGCSGNNKKMTEEVSDSTLTQAATPITEGENSVQDTVKTQTATEPTADKATENSEETEKYNAMLDKCESKINKCFSMSKKGLSINDQELADVWMDAGAALRKLDKVKKKMNEEQLDRLKKLNKRYQDFGRTQPS